MPSIADQNISPNRRPSKRTRDEDHDDIDDHYSSPSSSSKSSNSRSATINAAIRYRCEKQSDITPRLQELVCAFSSGQINRVRFHFAKGSFVIDPCNRDIYILVHLRRSVPWTKWDKIRSNSGGDEVIMKPADSWCNFYAFMMDRCSAFSCIERMVDNEDVFQVRVLASFPAFFPSVLASRLSDILLLCFPSIWRTSPRATTRLARMRS